MPLSIQSVEAVLADGARPAYRESARILRVKADNRLGIFCPGDIHIDSPHCRLDVLKRHFDRCVKNGYAIVINGDLFDAMQGRNDNRRDNKLSMAYWRELVAFAYNFLEPYFENILAMGHGNHETAPIRHNQVHLLHDLACEIQHRTGRAIPVMGYSWWIHLTLFRNKTQASSTMWLHHGWGGGARKTKSIMHFTDAMVMRRADVYVMAHTHQANIAFEKYRELRSSLGGLVERERMAYWIRPSSYKAQGTWEEEKGFPDSPLGGTLVDFKIRRTHAEGKDIIAIQTEPTGWYE